MTNQTTSTRTRPPAATAVAVLAVLGAVGSAVMTLAHLGLEVPVLDLVGPGRLIAPAAGGFAVGTVLYAVVAYGALRVARWAWPAGLVVNVLALLSATVPFRGWVSAVAALVSVAAVAVLVSRPGREAFGR